MVITTTHTPAVRKALLGSQTRPHRATSVRPAATRPSADRARSALQKALRG